MSDVTTKNDNHAITFVPAGEREEIRLTVKMVRDYLFKPTKSGAVAPDSEVFKFMMLCKARELNPWVGDAFVVGFDDRDGPQWTLITSHQALMKRADVHPQYDGLDSGVIVRTADKQIVDREGDFILPEETLLGAWAIVYRRDRNHHKKERITLAARDKNRSQWNSDKSGMLVKCAEASALRLAFPSQIGSLYLREEMVVDSQFQAQPQALPEPTNLDRLTQQIQTSPDFTPQPQAEPVEATKAESKSEPEQPPEPEHTDPIEELEKVLSSKRTEKTLNESLAIFEKQHEGDEGLIEQAREIAMRHFDRVGA